MIQDNIEYCLPALIENYYYTDICSDANGRFYAVGPKVQESPAGSGTWGVTGGRIVSSNTATNWNLPVDVGQDEFRAVAAGDGYVDAVGENRCAYYSLNGGPWQSIQGITRRPPSDGYPLETFVNVIHAGNGVFYALSNTGSRWTGGNKGNIYKIEDGAGSFVEGGVQHPIVRPGRGRDPKRRFCHGTRGNDFDQQQKLNGNPSEKIFFAGNAPALSRIVSIEEF